MGDNEAPNTITLVTTGNSNNGGSARFEGNVDIESAFTDLRTAGSLEIDGVFDAGAAVFTPPSGTATVTLLLGGSFGGPVAFTSTGALTLGSEFFSTGSALSFAGPVVLASDVLLNTIGFSDPNGANITFSSTINDSSGNAGSAGLIVISGSTGVATFGGAIGGTTPIGALNVGPAGGVTLGGNITTAGGSVTFTSAPTVLAASVVIDTTGNANSTGAGVLFDSASPIDSTNGTQSLAVNAGINSVEFDAALGAGQPLKSLSASGGQVTAESNITTAGGAVSAIAQGTEFGEVSIGGTITTTGGSTTGGNVTLSASGSDGALVTISGSSGIMTGAGNITVTAQGGSSSGEIDFGGVITTTTGNVAFTASSNSADASIYLYNMQTGSGNITVTAAGATSALIKSESNEIQTGSGNVTMTALGGSAFGEIEFVQGSLVQTTSGAVTLKTQGDSAQIDLGGTDNGNSVGSIQAGSGGVTLTANAIGSAAADINININSSLSTTSGAVALNATSAATNAEIDVFGGITTQGGSVALSATAPLDAFAFVEGSVSIGPGSGSLMLTAQGTAAFNTGCGDCVGGEGEAELDGTVTTNGGAVISPRRGPITRRSTPASSRRTVARSGSRRPRMTRKSIPTARSRPAAAPSALPQTGSPSQRAISTRSRAGPATLRSGSPRAGAGAPCSSSPTAPSPPRPAMSG